MFKKGQSLVELAVFGSLALLALGVLVRTGLSMNYEQELMMRSFRSGLLRAYGDRSGAGEVSETILKHKRIYDVKDKNMVGETEAFAAAADATWSYKLMLERDWNDADLPRVTYNINGERKTFTIGAYISGSLVGGDESGGDEPGGDKPGGDKPGGDEPGGDEPGGDEPGGPGDGGGSLPTPRFKKVGNPQNAPEDIRGKICGESNGHWYWVCTEWDDSEHVYEGASLELTGDVYEETLVHLEEADGVPTEYTAIDYTMGELNLMDEDLNHGLTGSFVKNTNTTGLITNNLQADRFNTYISTNVSEQITYEVKTREGSEYITTEALPQETEVDWGN